MRYEFVDLIHLMLKLLGKNQAKSTNKEQNRRENSERKGIKK
jgi:hypothetical protein